MPCHTVYSYAYIVIATLCAGKTGETGNTSNTGVPCALAILHAPHLSYAHAVMAMPSLH